MTLSEVDAMGGSAMKMMLCHLTGSLRGRTQYFDTDSISFGIGEHCGIVFDASKDSTVCPTHAELSVEDHTPILRDRSGQNALLVNGEPRLEASLKDGDLIQFGDHGPLVRFRLIPEGVPDSKPWRHIVADSRDIVVRTPHPRSMSPLYLARHLLADIARYGSPTVKIVAAVLIVVPMLAIVSLGLALYQQHLAAGASERRMAELVSRLETGRLTREEMEQRIERERLAVTELRRQQDALVEKLNAALQEQEAARRSQQELRAIRRQLSALESLQRFAEEITSRFENGVGLLQGGYGFREKGTGRLLRYQGFDPRGNPLLDQNGNTLVTVEGTAPPITIYYAGTGFLVDAAGTIVTNRHLVRMWESYEPAQEAIEAGFEPELNMLRMFLPGAPDPYNLTLVKVSDRTDLAVLRTDRAPTGASPLVLAPADEKVRVGEPVVLLSFPGSFDTLLARVPKPVSNEILARAAGHPAKLANEVAKQGLVRPLATQGHVSEISPDIITYEAGSATGSSGGPILNRAGRVIAVNHATLQRVGGVHLGLPIRFAGELLASLGKAESRGAAGVPPHPKEGS